MKIIHLTLSLCLSLTIISNGESAREKRLEQINKKLAENKLTFPHFAPSIHIAYEHPNKKPTIAYYNEITVKESVKHTYFCTIGFDVGYLGIQDHGSGPLAIFSVWDKGGGQNDSNAVDDSLRTKILYTNPLGKSSRFGGEGSGAKTMMPFKWELNKTYSTMVLLEPLEKGTVYSAWIAEKGKAWQKLASYRTVDTRKELRGFYSFLEDYARNGETGQKKRVALYPNQAVMTTEHQWLPVTSGRGTIGDDVIQNGHSGVKNNIFFSQSGAGSADYGTMPKNFSVKRDELPFKLQDLPAETKSVK